MEDSKIIIYKTEDDQTTVDVKLGEESVWLTQKQMAELFQHTKQSISLHINNIFKENELKQEAVVKEYLTTASDGKAYKTNYYNLDVIISVGYRVKSQRGTQFRIWANKILKDYLIKGYIINEKKLNEQTNRLNELKETVRLISSMITRKDLTANEKEGLINIINDYTYALDVLDDYDHQKLQIKETSNKEIYKLTIEDAFEVIKGLKEKFGGSELFGRLRDHSFQSTTNTIYQTFDGLDLYPSLEEKAANLLYLSIKNHSFTDGNKRIAAALFIWYLNKNNYLYRENKEKRIADNALVALCLMIAESHPKHKEVIVKVVINLINKKN